MFPNSRFDQRTLKYFDKIFKFLKFKKERKNFAFLLKGVLVQKFWFTSKWRIRKNSEIEQ